MKNYLPLIILIGLLSSCEIYFENVYDEREAFTGRWKVEEFSELSESWVDYKIDIYESEFNDNVVYIYNLYDVDIEIYAEVNYDQVIIPIQVVNDYRIEGVGNLDEGSFSLTFTVRDVSSNARHTDFLVAEAWR